jgi:hypothetical protein
LSTRVQTKILHLRGRLLHIEVGQLAQQVDPTTQIKQIRAQLDDIEGVMASAEQPEHRDTKMGGERTRDEVSTPVFPINLGAERERPPVAPPVTPGCTSVPRESYVFNASSFQKLPHPLACLLKEIPVIDGGDVDLVWDFLFFCSTVATVWPY